MTRIELYRSIIDKLKDPNNESLKFSMNDVHAPGLFSLVYDGNEPGKLKRIFIAKKKLKPLDVQLHTHRYPIVLTAIKGNIVHHEAHLQNPTKEMEVSLPMFKYKSFLCGGDGLSFYQENAFVVLRDYIIPSSGQIRMGNADIHSVSCSKGSIWIVEEGGFSSDHSYVLGNPFITEGLYSKPEMFQINDNIQLVINELKKLISLYELALTK